MKLNILLTVLGQLIVKFIEDCAGKVAAFIFLPGEKRMERTHFSAPEGANEGGTFVQIVRPQLSAHLTVTICQIGRYDDVPGFRG